MQRYIVTCFGEDNDEINIFVDASDESDIREEIKKVNETLFIKNIVPKTKDTMRNIKKPYLTSLSEVGKGRIDRRIWGRMGRS